MNQSTLTLKLTDYLGGAKEAWGSESGQRIHDLLVADIEVQPQVIESVNETFKGQLNLEQHRGRTPAGVIARVTQRILALTATIWRNDHTGQPILRSLTAHDH